MKQAWHAYSDYDYRCHMIEEISRFFQNCPELDMLIDWQISRPCIVRKLELALYMNALSLEEYMDVETLKDRINEVAIDLQIKRIQQNDVPSGPPAGSRLNMTQLLFEDIVSTYLPTDDQNPVTLPITDEPVSSNQELIESCNLSSEVSSNLNLIRDFPNFLNLDVNQNLCQSLLQEPQAITNIPNIDMPQISLNYNTSTDYLEPDVQNYSNTMLSQQQYSLNIHDFSDILQEPMTSIVQCSHLYNVDNFPMTTITSTTAATNVTSALQSLDIIDESFSDDIFKFDYNEDADDNIGNILQFCDSDVRKNKNERDTATNTTATAFEILLSSSEEDVNKQD